MMNYNKRIFNPLLLVVFFLVVFGAGFLIGQNQIVCRVCAPENVDFSLFWDAYDKLHQKFINPDEIKDQQIIYGAISGMAKSLGDPNTDFFNPDQAKVFRQDLLGSFEGIGVEIGMKKDQLTVIAPLKNSPGEKAGLKAGDQILKIDGQSTLDISIEEAVKLIRGKKGTGVTLTVFREEWDQPKDIKIIRDTIKIEALQWELQGDVAYIHIIQFKQSLSADFRKVALEVLNSPAQKVILDLRNNPGGFLEVAQDIAGWFVQKGQVVTIEDFGRDEEQKIYKSEGPGSLAHYPIVVLINKGSASASEILAGALRDNRGVKLVGEKSFGKGSVQEVVNLRDNASFLKITIAKWLTPKGVSISDAGLSPDVKVEITDDDIKKEKDPQLQKALEIVKGLK